MQLQNCFTTACVIGAIGLGCSARCLGQGCDPVEVSRLRASDSEDGDGFGRSVAYWDDRMVVKSSSTDAAYIFRRDGETWVEEAKLVPSGGGLGGSYNRGIAGFGDTVVVGAWGFGDTGAAYVFRYTDGVWLEEAILVTDDVSAEDRFGRTVAIGENTVMVSADLTDGFAGKVYVFEYDGNRWTETDRLISRDRKAFDHLGTSLALSGNLVVVGAEFSDGRGGSNTGSASVFRHDGSRWVEEATLTASDGMAHDNFGIAVAISGETIVAGAVDGVAPGDGTGACYVFRFNGQSWVEEVKLRPAEYVFADAFGAEVAISDDGQIVIVGAPHDSERQTSIGAAYVFRNDRFAWVEEAKLLSSNHRDYDQFGGAIVFAGEEVFIGSPGDWQGGSLYGFELGCPPANCFELGVVGLIAGGKAEIRLSGGTPGARAATVFGFEEGRSEFVDYDGYCVAFGIEHINRTRVIGGTERTFDDRGVITIHQSIPAYAKGLGVFFQSAEGGT